MCVPKNIQLKCFLTKNMKKRAGVSIFMGDSEYQGLVGWKEASDWRESFTKTGLVGAIKRTWSNLDSRRPGTGWVGSSEQSGRE